MRIETTRHRGCVVLRARGVLDHAGRAAFSTHVRAEWDRSPGTVLVFDLGELLFYDSSAVGVLAVVLQRMRVSGGGRLVLVRPTGHLLDVLRRTGLLAYVEVRDSVAEILAELNLREPREPQDRFRYGRQP